MKHFVLMLLVTLIYATAITAGSHCWADSAADAQQAEGLMRSGEYEAAIAAYEALMARYPDTPQATVRTWYNCIAACNIRLNNIPEYCAAMEKTIDLAAGAAVRREQRVGYAYFLLHHAQKHADALAQYQQLVQDHPQDASAAAWHRGIAECYFDLGNVPDYCTAMKKAIEMAADPEVRRTYRVDYAYKALYYAKRYDDALAEYRQLVNDHPQDAAAAEWYNHTAACCFGLKNIPEYCTAMDKAIVLVADPAVRMSYRVGYADNLLRYAQKYADALAQYQQLVQDYPQDASAAAWHRGIAECYFDLGNVPDYCTAMKKAIEMAADPEVRRTYRVDYAYKALYYAKRYDDALAEYRQLVNDHPQDAAAAEWCLRIALCLEGKAEYDQVITMCKGLSANSNTDKEIKRSSRFLVAKCLREQGKYREEIDYLKTVAEQHPENRLEALLWTGEDSFVYLKDHDTGLVALKQVLAEMPPYDAIPSDEKELMKQIGDAAKDLLIAILSAKGDVDQAVETIDERMEEDQSAAAVYIGEIYFNAKRYTDAIAVYEELRGSAMLPNENQASIESRARAIYTLAYCYREVGNGDKAISTIREVIEQYPDTGAAANARTVIDSWLAGN